MIEWIRIIKISEPRQRDLFVRSEKIYYDLFGSKYTEPWENFAKYIEDTENRRPKDQSRYPKYYFEDFYFVGVIDDVVWGIMFFTGYSGPVSHGFVSYMGVVPKIIGENTNEAARIKLVRMMPSVIANNLEAMDCQYFLFELEKVNPEDINSPQRNIEIDHDLNICARIKITNAFQRMGAKKIGWINYRQPKLSWLEKKQKVPMHLMYMPTSRRFEVVPEVLRKDEVKKIVKFVYLKFYKDGFKQSTRNQIELVKWHIYLNWLMHDTVKDLPDVVPLLTIDLRKPREKIFISYPNALFRIARRAQDYIQTLGFPVFFWEKDKKRLLGKVLDKELLKELEESKVILFFCLHIH